MVRGRRSSGAPCGTGYLGGLGRGTANGALDICPEVRLLLAALRNMLSRNRLGATPNADALRFQDSGFKPGVERKDTDGETSPPAPHHKDHSMPQRLRFASPAFLLGALTMIALAQPTLPAHAAAQVTEYTLANGLQVVVVPDNRAPVVTHMVWYRVGAADEPAGTSGIAHFLEHLMFKSTEKLATGEFSKIVSRLGGQDNAFTSQDTTAYFQRVA